MSRQVFFQLDPDIERALAERYPDMRPGTAVRHYLRETLGSSRHSEDAPATRRDIESLEEIIWKALGGKPEQVQYRGSCPLSFWRCR